MNENTKPEIKSTWLAYGVVLILVWSIAIAISLTFKYFGYAKTLVIAESLMKNGQYDLAINQFDSILDKEPTSLRAVFGIVETLAKEGSSSDIYLANAYLSKVQLSKQAWQNFAHRLPENTRNMLIPNFTN